MAHRATTALEFAFTCPLSSGLHARPASHLAEEARRFASELLLTNQRNRTTANLKSVLAILACDVKNGDPCSIRIFGTDEQQAHAGLRRFIEQTLPGCDVPLAQSLA